MCIKTPFGNNWHREDAGNLDRAGCRIKPFPVILVDSSYWKGILEWLKGNLLVYDMISKEDLNIFKIMDDPEEIVEYVKRFVIL